MALGVIMFIAWLAFMALSVFAFIMWAKKEGQMNDIEEAKFRMLEDREPEPWPERKKRGRSPSGTAAPPAASKGDGK